MGNGQSQIDGGTNTMNQNITRVVIVGGGPIGLELAAAFQQRSIDFQIIEAGSIGNTMTWWAPQTRWFSSNERISIAGVPLMTVDGSKATREEYLMYLRSVAAQFSLNTRTFEKVTSINRNSAGGFTVASDSVGGRSLTRCDKVVLAIGGTDFPRLLGVPGEQLAHVDGYLREPHRYCGRRVLIVGGRNSAAEAALRLHHAGAMVAISYRGEELPEDGIKYWILPEIRGLIAAGRIEAHFGTVVKSITGSHVTLFRNVDQSTRDVAADDVLSLIGYEQDKSLFEAAGVDLIEATRRPVHEDQTMETNVPGIYVAGTGVAGTQTSKYKTFLENCHEHVDKIVGDIAGGVVMGDNVKESRAYETQIEAQPES